MESTNITNWNKNNWIFIKPSICNPNIKYVDPVKRNDVMIDYNSAHAISFNFNSSNQTKRSNILHIFLAGTGCNSEVNPCSHLLNASVDLGYPTIALSYQWGNHTDSERNLLFSNSNDAQLLLESYHHDVIHGGNSSRIVDVSECNSVISRLRYLLEYLSINYDNRWSQYYELVNDNIVFKFDQMIFSGHSQGSGHVAYLSKYHKLSKVILLSGPQEYISNNVINENSASWLSGDFKTSDIKAFKHIDEELTSALIDQNWLYLPKFNNKIFHFTENNLSLHENDYNYFTSTFIPSKYGISTRPNHMSTVSDILTPRDGNNNAIYSTTIWLWLLS